MTGNRRGPGDWPRANVRPPSLPDLDSAIRCVMGLASVAEMAEAEAYKHYWTRVREEMEQIVFELGHPKLPNLRAEALND